MVLQSNTIDPILSGRKPVLEARLPTTAPLAGGVAPTVRTAKGATHAGTTDIQGRVVDPDDKAIPVPDTRPDWFAHAGRARTA